jgi:hypothetical protein
MSDDRDDKRAKAEIAIERILFALQEATEKIDHVEIDTRNFANLNVEIFFKSERAQ